MNFKEIMVLRRENRHAEALTAARAEHSAHPGDIWLKRALAWCLYDALKSCPQDDVMVLGKEVEALELPEKGEEMFRENWDAVWSRRTLSLPARLAVLQALADRGGLSPEAATAYNRNLCEFLRGLSPEKDMAQGAKAWDLFRQQILPLLPPGHAGVRWAALAFCPFAAGLDGFMSFLLEQVLPHLLADDWAEKTISVAGKMRTVSSNAGKFAKAGDLRLKRELPGRVYAASSTAGRLLNRWLGFLEELRTRTPTNVWAHLYAARTLGLLGRAEEARPCLATLLLDKPHDFWAWESFGDTWPETSEEKLACFLRGLDEPGPDGMKVGLCHRTASLLLAMGRKGHAKSLWEQESGIRRHQGWSDKAAPHLSALKDVEAEPIPSGKWEEARHLSNELLRRVAEGETENAFAGILKLLPAGFGFVDDVFVPPNLLGTSGLAAGQRVKGVAVGAFDPRKNRMGRRAVLLLADEKSLVSPRKNVHASPS